MQAAEQTVFPASGSGWMRTLRPLYSIQTKYRPPSSTTRTRIACAYSLMQRAFSRSEAVRSSTKPDVVATFEWKEGSLILTQFSRKTAWAAPRRAAVRNRGSPQLKLRKSSRPERDSATLSSAAHLWRKAKALSCSQLPSFCRRIKKAQLSNLLVRQAVVRMVKSRQSSEYLPDQDLRSSKARRPSVMRVERVIVIGSANVDSQGRISNV